MIQRRSSPDDWFHKNATPKQRTNLDIYGRTLYITRARSQVALAGGVRGLWVNRPGIGSGAGIQTPMHVTTDKSQSIPSTYSFFLFPKHKTHTCSRVRDRVLWWHQSVRWPPTSRQPRGDSSLECGYGLAFLRL